MGLNHYKKRYIDDKVIAQNYIDYKKDMKVQTT